MFYKTQRLLSSLNQPADTSNNPPPSHDVGTFRGEKNAQKRSKIAIF